MRGGGGGASVGLSLRGVSLFLFVSLVECFFIFLTPKLGGGTLNPLSPPCYTIGGGGGDGEGPLSS